MNYPDYLSRADFLCEKLKLNRQKVNEELVNQSKIINEKTKNVIKIKSKILGDVNSFIECSTKMLSIFSALGGDCTIDKPKRDLAIKHSGDTKLNGMSLVRESGILESIQ